MTKVLMLAYAQYYNDARIKGYVSALLEKGIAVDVVCLFDQYSDRQMSEASRFSITYVGRKYQGKSKVRYILSYLAFFLKASCVVSWKYLRERYPIIHVHNQPDFLVFCAVIPMLCGASVILDMHDIMIAGMITKYSESEDSLWGRLIKYQTRMSVRHSDVLVCADHSQKEYLAEKGIGHTRTYVMLNLPDEKVFHPRRSEPHNPVFSLIYHGTVSHRLGLDLAIEAVEKAHSRIPVCLTIIGNGDDKAELVEYCDRKGINGSLVRFMDFVPTEDLQSYIERHDLGIIANRRTVSTERCMLPVKLMEYVWIGLPVVVPRLPVIQRYFSDDMVCYYEPENVDELSELIVSLSRNPQLRASLVEKSRGFFARHNWQTQKLEYLGLIGALVTK